MKVRLDDGAGGERMNRIIERITSLIRLKTTKNGSGIDKKDDSGVFEINGMKFAFTTDSYTINPIFSPGGNIGSLAVHGTVNDLAVVGARPIALTLAYIVEEGFDIGDLEKITRSINESTYKIGVPVISGDFKVVEKGKLDKIVINTSGVGLVKKLVTDYGAEPGDRIIVSGTVGDHGMAILAERFGFETDLKSDSAPVINTVMDILDYDIKAMKDPTRGGLASALNELSKKSNTCFYIYEDSIPVRKDALSVAETLGVDVLQTACEGRIVVVVSEEDSEEVLKIMRRHDKNASIIGEVREEPRGRVLLETLVGGRRILESPIGEQYPRIC